MLDDECPRCRYRVGHSPDCGRDESLPCATCHDDPHTRWCGRCGRGDGRVPAYLQRELTALRADLAAAVREREEARAQRAQFARWCDEAGAEREALARRVIELESERDHQRQRRLDWTAEAQALRALLADALRCGLAEAERLRDEVAFLRDALGDDGEARAFEPSHAEPRVHLREVFAQLLRCAGAWMPEVRIVGNVRAGDIRLAVCTALEEFDRGNEIIREARAERDAARLRAARLRAALQRCAALCAQHVVYRDARGRLVEAMRAATEAATAALADDAATADV